MTGHVGSRVAAVDIGTNSTRLLIAEVEDGVSLRTLDRRLVITRLGQGVDATGRLAPEAIGRVAAAVTTYATAWRDAGVDRVGITATSASRDAADGEILRRTIHDIAGVDPRVLSGEEEAALAFAGAVSGLPDVDRPVAVLDIGGGSTEVIVGTARPERSTSRQIGSVRLTERVLRSTPPTAEQVTAARRTVAAELDVVAELVDPTRATALIGVAGTVTTLAAIELELPRWTDGAVHGTRLSAGRVVALTARLLALPTADIAAIPAVQQGREDVIAAGALILEAVMDRFGFDEVVVSEADILDGLALQLLADG